MDFFSIDILRCFKVLFCILSYRKDNFRGDFTDFSHDGTRNSCRHLLLQFGRLLGKKTLLFLESRVK